MYARVTRKTDHFPQGSGRSLRQTLEHVPAGVGGWYAEVAHSHCRAGWARLPDPCMCNRGICKVLVGRKSGVGPCVIALHDKDAGA